MGPATSPPPPTPTSTEVSDASVNSEVLKQMESNLDDTKSKLDAAQLELLECHRKMSTLQDEVSALKDSIIEMKDSQLERSMTAVQTVVKEEMSSYSSVLQSAATTVKQSCESALAPTKLRAALASASSDRSSNLILYGLPETTDSSDIDQVKDIFQHLEEAPVLSGVERLGRRTEERVRPVRVVLRSRDIARTVLGKSARLRESELYKTVYISPDRTFEERDERRELVKVLKEKREREPEKEWRIKSGSVVEKVKRKWEYFVVK